MEKLMKPSKSKIKWTVFLFAIISIVIISIQCVEIYELQDTIKEMQNYIKYLEYNG